MPGTRRAVDTAWSEPMPGPAATRWRGRGLRGLSCYEPQWAVGALHPRAALGVVVAHAQDTHALSTERGPRAVQARARGRDTPRQHLAVDLRSAPRPVDLG